ncbi:MAG TPA: nuclear transport factor 2 family protein [Solirubrobacterales bacterium]|nr:nuclear transport factor 2 family protein [Solirubrobacterales bacterium]
MSAAPHHERIRALTYEYTFRLDRGDFSGVAELLASGQLRMAAKGMDDAPIRGAAAIEAFYAGQVVTYDGDPRTRHLITNHVVEVDAEAGSAGGECYFTVLQAVPRQPIGTVVCGRYHDRFELADEEWRFVEKVIQVDYLGAIGEHFAIDADHAAR